MLLSKKEIVPSVTLGSAAGTKVSASADSGSASVSLPFIKIGAKTPKLTVGVPGTEKVSISTEGIKAAGAKKKGPAKKKAGAKKK